MTHKVLLADHQANLLLSLEYLLRRRGHEVVTASDGNRVLPMVQQDPPAIVVLDVMLPGRSGFELCQQIRNDAALAEIPVVLTSARARDTDMAKARALGASALIVKPFPVEMLVDHIDRLLRTDP